MAICIFLPKCTCPTFADHSTRDRRGKNVTNSPIFQKSNDHDSPIPEEQVSLESILCTDELRKRPSRAPDYQKENRALVALSDALADSPRTVLQTLAETILEVCESGSAGISLLTKDDRGKRFYWPAIAGKWKTHIGGGTPRDFGPCGDVLDRNTTLLFTQRRTTLHLLPTRHASGRRSLVGTFLRRGQGRGDDLGSRA